MTLRCASCGRRVRAFTLTVQTSRGPVGYGPKCARDVALQAAGFTRHQAWVSGIRPDEIDRIRSVVRSLGWDGKRIGRRPRGPRRAAVAAQPVASAQLTLEFEPA